MSVLMAGSSGGHKLAGTTTLDHFLPSLSGMQGCKHTDLLYTHTHTQSFGVLSFDEDLKTDFSAAPADKGVENKVNESISVPE